MKMRSFPVFLLLSVVMGLTACGGGGGGGGGGSSSGGDAGPATPEPVTIGVSAGIDHEASLASRVVVTAIPQGAVTAFSWRIATRPTGSGVVLDAANQQTVLFQPDSTGDYTLEVTATDGTQSVTAEVTVTVVNKAIPLAVAITGEASAIYGEPLSLTAIPTGGSGNYSYQWTVIKKPVGAAAEPVVTGADAQTVQATFLAPGKYTLKVDVNDGAETSTVARTIQVDFAAPLQVSVGKAVVFPRIASSPCRHMQPAGAAITRGPGLSPMWVVARDTLPTVRIATH